MSMRALPFGLPTKSSSSNATLGTEYWAQFQLTPRKSHTPQLWSWYPDDSTLYDWPSSTSVPETRARGIYRSQLIRSHGARPTFTRSPANQGSDLRSYSKCQLIRPSAV